MIYKNLKKRKYLWLCQENLFDQRRLKLHQNYQPLLGMDLSLQFMEKATMGLKELHLVRHHHLLRQVAYHHHHQHLVLVHQ